MSEQGDDSPADVAQRSAEALWRDDRASRALGMEIEHIGPGEAVLSMVVRDDMVNGHDLCHGGFIFLLADSALAFASNSYNQRAVAQHNSVTFVEPAHSGDRLIASARELSRKGRSGLYDVTVTRGDTGGVVIAEMRGHTRTIRGAVFSQAAQKDDE